MNLHPQGNLWALRIVYSVPHLSFVVGFTFSEFKSRDVSQSFYIMGVF